MSTTTPFAPIGVEARWKPIYRLIQQAPAGATITYAAFHDALGYDLRTDRGDLYRAMRELEKADHRTIANVPGEGYRVVDAPEHGDLARKHQQRSGRQVRKARQKLVSADPTRLTAEQRDQFEAWAMRLGHAESMIRRLHARTTALEKKATASEKQQEAIATDLAHVKQVLARHGLLAPEAKAA